MTAGRMVVVAVVAMALSACAASRQRADEALKDAENAITAQHADAMRFAPEAFAAVMESYGAARAAYKKEDWAGAIAAAENTAARARQMAPAIAGGKEQATARWPVLHDSVSAMLSALDARLADAERTRRVPPGMTAANLGLARAQVDTLRTGLDQAAAAFGRGDLADALHAAERIQMQAGSLMASVGLRPSNPHGM